MPTVTKKKVTKKRATKSVTKQKVKEKSELEEVLSVANEKFGANTVRTGRARIQPDRCSTGSFILDFCLLGGLPLSRTNMYLGEPHAGKSTMTYKYIASMQRMFPDSRVVLLDIEKTFDPVWAEKLGVLVDDLYVSEIETGEMAVDIGTAVIQSKETSLLVVDSIAAMEPTKEVESSAEDQHVSLQARLISSFMRRVLHSIVKERKRDHWVTVHLINQFRDKIGGFTRGDPRVYPGGRALKHATSIEVILKNKENKGKDVNGVDTMSINDHSFTVKKNKLNNGPRSGEFQLLRVDDDSLSLVEGDIDDAHTVLSYAKKFGLYTGAGTGQKLDCDAGSWKFSKVAQAEAMLREDRDIYWALRTEIIQMQAASLKMPEEFISRIGDQPVC